MKIKNYLVIHLFNDFSGSPLVLSNCIEALIAGGHQVELLTSGEDGFLSRYICSKNIINYRRFGNRIFVLISFSINQIMVFFSVLSKTILLKKNRKPVILVNTMLPFGAALAARLSGCHVVYYVHEVSIRPLFLKRWLKLVLKITANEIIYVSEYLKKNEGVSIGSIKEHVIFNSLPSELKITPIIIRDNRFTVFMPSSLKKYKGVYEFIEISIKMEKTGTHFVLALNASEINFNEFINKNFIPNNLEVIRRPVDINAIYRRSSLVLNLSHPDEWIETFGMTVIEAFIHGCPVITPTVGGICEIVTEGYDGFKLSVVNIEAIMDKIKSISDDSCLYESLVLNSFKSAEKFKFSEYKDRILNVL